MTTPIKFTPTKPTEAGAYWVRDRTVPDPKVRLAEVYMSAVGMRVHWHNTDCAMSMTDHLEWSGPLYPRDEP